MASRSRVTGVAEIVLSVVDLPRMREFYPVPAASPRSPLKAKRRQARVQ